MPNCPPPYRPFRGADPPHFVDRTSEEELSMFGIVGAGTHVYQNGPRDLRFHRLVAGAPAVGKTALLRAMCRQVQTQLGWASVLHRCQAKERAMGSLPDEVLTSVNRRWKGARLSSLSSSSSPAGPSGRSKSVFVEEWSSWARLKTVLEVCGHVGSTLGRGLLVALDDVDLLSAGEAESFGYLARRLAFQGLPVALLMSGSLSLARRFRRSGNFSGTLWATTLTPFDVGEVREAIVVPASERGVEFEDRALELVCEAAGGSPLAVQRIGFASWAAAGGRKVVGPAEVEAAIGRGPGCPNVNHVSVVAMGPGQWPAAELAAVAQ